ncbi:metallophosphoesterase family protein [Pedobacter gandavensis]|uniref:Metallophosphoesterase n=1 Tax=Pedobacter gandavensis TaxID=2679963 RepID=A0ABR6ER72_9SPHI|nr:metallophosphoesterase [Pedobacter gandavensis]MBB2147759.1 metallophosphoesterase [Pedobacter gandavensis]
MNKFILLGLVLSVGLGSCNRFEYSTDQSFDRNSPRDLNATNLKKLGEGKNDKTVRFILTGDTQRSRDETVSFVKKVNEMTDIDFVLVAGDFTEFGVLKEMEWIARSLAKLNVPYMGVIGNHDMTGRGKKVFERMFGALNYSFSYGGTKFVCHDTNSREYSFNGMIPNIPWLNSELQPEEGVSNYLAVSHVSPISTDFDTTLVKDYTGVFAQTPGFLASLHAHSHVYDLFYPDDSKIPYVVTSAMGNEEFLLVEIINHKISFERISF